MSEKRRWKKWGFFLIILGIFLLLQSGCVEKTEKPISEVESDLAEKIESPIYEVKRGTVVKEIRLIGQITGTLQEELYFRADGYVRLVRIQQGDRIKKGKLLAELEIEGLKKELAQARVNLETAELRLEEAKKENAHEVARAEINLLNSQSRLAQTRCEDPQLQIAIARANLDKAALALKIAKLNEELSGTHRDTPSPALEEAILNHEIALANYNLTLQAEEKHNYQLRTLENEVSLTRLNLERLREGVSSLLYKQVESARLSYERLELRVDDARIVAPFEGEIISTSLSSGKLIAAFKPVITIADPKKLEIVLGLSSEEIPTITIDKEVTFTSSKYPREMFFGKVNQLPDLFSGTQKRDFSKDEYLIYIDFDYPKFDFEIGDLVRAAILLEKAENVLYLPPAAIRTFRGRTFVVVQEGEQQRRIDIKLGIQGEEGVEIIGNSLKKGQLVVGL